MELQLVNAAVNGRIEEVRSLLARGVNPNSRDSSWFGVSIILLI